MRLNKEQVNKSFYVTAFIEGKFYIFLILYVSCYAYVPLNSGWRSNGGACTTV
jgi:hypothetical protein